ncbi:condensation domain-containing protein [Micromonospora sp. NPDC047793]|uniref:condensation domain-containing protein n=1 Tax=unclassified Micromonospora TaxID=2617518 RepID=UPI001034B9E0|nr:condensation domain-containing protein [Verrucosispora sp. SN26_14.1]TBL45553.1 hypothetical protein EYA84_00080 [Verrucosispora sp. SN26_14.1]
MERKPGHDLVVTVRGARQAQAAASWAQREIWGVISWLGDQPQSFTMREMVPVPEGVTVAGVGRALEEVVARVDVLRTRLVMDATGLRQEVDGSGTLTVPVWSAAPDRVIEDAKELVAAMTATVFDLAEQWPVRFALVLADETPAALVLNVSHAAVDAIGLALLKTELRDALAGVPVEPVESRWQPLDQAAYEASEPGRRRSRRAVRFREDLLGEVPESLVPPSSAPPHTPRIVQVDIESSAVAVAAELLADRQRVSTSAVLLAAQAAVVSHHTGADPAFLTLIVGGRVERRLQTMIGPVVQNGLFRVDVGTGSFTDLVTRCYRQALLTYQHGNHDTVELAEAQRRVATRRGFVPQVGVFFNDAREQQRWSGLPQVRSAPQELAEDLAALCRDTRIEYVTGWEQQDLTVFLSVSDASGAAALQLRVDTAYLGVEDARRILAGIESLLVAAAVGDLDMRHAGQVLGVRPAAGPTGSD